MTVMAPPVGTQPARLRVVQGEHVETEGPFVDATDEWFDGSLALESPEPIRLPVDAPERPPLRLVPAPAPDPTAPEPTAPEPVAAPLRPAAAAPDVSFAAVRTPRAALPPPRAVAPTLVRAVLEVIAGDRPVRQLARCATAAVYDELEVLVSPRADRPWAGTLRRVLVSEPAPGVAEVTAVVSRGARAAALAMRLEGVDGRWQLTAVQVV